MQLYRDEIQLQQRDPSDVLISHNPTTRGYLKGLSHQFHTMPPEQEVFSPAVLRLSSNLAPESPFLLTNFTRGVDVSACNTFASMTCNKIS